MSEPTSPDRYALVVAANRLPIKTASGTPRWADRVGGGPATLGPVIAARRGAWVGWTGQADTQTKPFDHDGLRLQPVPMSRQEVDDYERGQCATSIAPLYHNRVDTPVFRTQWRDAYQQVNERFAETIAAVAAPGGIVWVHDYHLQLVPGHLRRHRPDVLVGFFMHAPFPPVELFMQLPTRISMMSGLLGADLVGFQHPRAAATFLDLAERLLGLPASDRAVLVDGRRVAVGAFPASIDAAAVQRLSRDPDIQAQAAGIRASLGNPRTVLLAINRLDPAEGIEQRLDVYAGLLTSGRLDPTDSVLIEMAAPGSPNTGRRERLYERVGRRVAQINGEHARVGHPVVHYLRHEPSLRERVALYLAADVMLTTPPVAGPASTAKEFITARHDDAGRLVVSESGHGGLPGAIAVNPHDPDALADAIRTAAADAGRRSPVLATTRNQLRTEAVDQWTDKFLRALGDCAHSRASATACRPARAGRPTLLGNAPPLAADQGEAL